MANISGIFNSSYFTNVAANVKPSFAQAMSYLMPNGSAPLFAMSGYLPKASAINYEHSYWQKVPNDFMQGFPFSQSSPFYQEKKANNLPIAQVLYAMNRKQALPSRTLRIAFY